MDDESDEPTIQISRPFVISDETIRVRPRTLPATIRQDQAPAMQPLREAVGSLGRYPIVGHLGAGGMGEILLVRDEELGRDLAAKVILGEPGAVLDQQKLEKFLLEAQITGQLQHPNIVPIHELGLTEEGQVYFTMKRVEGEDLAQRLGTLAVESRHRLASITDHTRHKTQRRYGERSPAAAMTQLLEILLKVCAAIGFAHSRGVIHRDLKPANIMVGRFGEVQVMDWGLAKLIGHPDLLADAVIPDLQAGRLGRVTGASDSKQPLQTMDGVVMGTPAYMPPEQAEGRIDEIDGRADIYALGAILYEMLTYEPPYVGKHFRSVLERVTQGALISPSARSPERSIPWELEAVVLKAMALEPADRYQQVAQLEAEIQAYLDGRTLSAVRYSLRQRLTKWVLRNRAASLASVAVLLMGIGLFWGFRIQADRQQARELARKERLLLVRAAGLRKKLTTQRARLARLKGPHSPRLRQPNGELARSAVSNWYQAHTDTLDLLGKLAALGQQVPTPWAGRMLNRPAIDRERQALSLSAARMAARLGDYTLARVWVSRASIAGLNDRQAQQLRRWVARLRRQRAEASVRQARRVLRRARHVRTDQTESFESNLTELVRRRGPDLVRLLLRREYLDSPHEWVRRLAIEALGKMGDTRTLGEEGMDPVQALCSRLQRIDLERQMESAVSLARALGFLRDARAHAILNQRRWQAGQQSRFWKRTEGPYRRIPLAARAPETVQQFLQRGNALAVRGDFDAAIADYDRALLLEPGQASVYKNRGLARAGKGNYKGAIADYKQAIRLRGLDPGMYNCRGGAWLELGQLSKAIADFTGAIGLAPNAPAGYRNRGRARARQKNWKGALEDFTRVLALSPEHMQTYNNRGIARRYLGDTAGAIKDFGRAIKLNPRYAAAYANRGRAYTDLGDHVRALEDYTRALRIDPKSPVTYSNRSVAYYKRGQLARAIADATRAIELRPGFVAAYFNRANARYLQGDSPGALRDYRQAIRLDPKHADSYNNRGNIFLAQNKLVSALRSYDRAIELRPNDARNHHNRGWARELKGDARGALEDYDLALRLNPRYAQAYNTRGVFYVKHKKPRRALEDFTQAIKINPWFGEAYLNRGIAYRRLEQLERAMADYNQAIEISPERAEAYRKRGELRAAQMDAFGSMRDYQRALKLEKGRSSEGEFARRIERNPEDAEAHMGRGLLREIAGRLPLAIADYRRALEIKPRWWRPWYAYGRGLSRLGRSAQALDAMRAAHRLAPATQRTWLARLLRTLAEKK